MASNYSDLNGSDREVVDRFMKLTPEDKREVLAGCVQELTELADELEYQIEEVQ